MKKVSEIKAMGSLAQIRKAYSKLGINQIIAANSQSIKAMRDLAREMDPILRKAADKTRGKIIQIDAPANEEIAILQQVMGITGNYKGKVNGILDKATLESLSKFFGRKITIVTSATFTEIKNVLLSQATALENQKAAIEEMRKKARNYRVLKDVTAGQNGVYDVSIKDLRRFATMSREIISILDKNGMLGPALKFCGSLADRKNFKSIYDLMNSLSDKMWENVIKVAMGRMLLRDGYQVKLGRERYKIDTINQDIAKALLYHNSVFSFTRSVRPGTAVAA